MRGTKQQVRRVLWSFHPNSPLANNSACKPLSGGSHELKPRNIRFIPQGLRNILGVKNIMSFWDFIFFAIVALIIYMIFDHYDKKIKHQEFLDRLTPEGRANYDKKVEEDRIKKEKDIFIEINGEINQELICPHCQTKGFVHSKWYSINRVVDGKIGGILKTNVKINKIESGTARYCAKCKSRWTI